MLCVRGTLVAGVVRVAVVGARTRTRYRERLALGLAGQLAARGVENVSGGRARYSRARHLEYGRGTRDC
jgi:predicted Rossmann fold nucleotide-binding protein DprA/Smf involved in DNA uptake